jgi:hypothetical protein
MTAHGFDEKCYELAKYFLEDDPLLDTEENRRILAQAIQDEIEQDIEAMR